MRRSTKATLLRSSALATFAAIGAMGASAPAHAVTANSIAFDQVSTNGTRCLFTFTRNVTGVTNDFNGADQYFIAVVDTATGLPNVTGPVGRSVPVGQTENVTETIISFAGLPRSTFEVAVFERVGTQIGAKLASDPVPRAALIAGGPRCAEMAANAAPNADAGPDQAFNTTLASGIVLPLDASGSSDPDNDAITFAWTQVSGPAATITNANQANPSISFPTLTGPTVFEFQVAVTDAALETSTDTVRISLTPPPNIAPTVDAGPDQTVAGSTNVSLTGTASDGDNDPLTFQWTQTGGPGVALTGDTTLTPSFTAPPRAATPQVLTFDLTADDGTTTTTDSVTITVAGNQAPNADAGTPQTVDEGTQVTLDGSATSDPEGDGLIYNWTQISGPAVTLTGASTTTPSFTAPPKTNAPQVLEFQLAATDTFDATGTATVTVTVNANQAPVADAGQTQTVLGTSQVSLDGSGSNDPDGDALTYNWVQTGGPAVTLNNASAVNPTFIAPAGTNAAQNLQFTLTVTDTLGLTSTSSVQIAVTANNPPIANAGAQQTVGGGAAVTLDASASSDPDGEPLTYNWVQTAGPAVTLSNASSVSPSFTAPGSTLSQQTLAFTVTVTDPNGAQDTSSVSIFVTANGAPMANAGPAQNVEGGANVTLDGSASSDPDNDPLTYSWTQISGPSVTLNGANTVNPSFVAPAKTNAVQTLEFQLAVSDPDGASSTSVVVISIAANQLPVANAGQAQTVAGGAAVTLDASGSSDPDGDALTYNWVQTSGPTVTLSDPSAVAPTFTAPPKTNNPQPIEFALTVTDTTGGAATASVVVTVAANQLPLADAGPDQSVSGNAAVTLDGSGSSDPDGDTIFYTWVQTGGPSVTLSGANSVSPTFTAPQGITAAQTLTFQLTVTDDDGSGIPGGANPSTSRVAPPNLQQDTVEITILANQPPVADAGADQGPIDAGQTVTLDGSGSSDPDGDALAFTWTQVSGTPVTLTGGTTAAPTFVAPVVNGTEDLVFSLVVDDGQTQSAADTVTISIRAVGTVTIIQRVIGGDTAVAFTSDIAALNANVTTSGGTAQVSASEVVAGSYSVSVNDIRAAGFALTDITCNDSDSVANVAGRSVALELSPGEDLVCTFTSTNSRAAAQSAIADFLTGRNALILSHQPDLQRRLDRLDGIQAQSGSASAFGVPVPGSGSLPFAAQLSNGSARASTSLAMVQSAISGPDRPVKPFDIWGEAFISDVRLGSQDATFRIFHVGADYLVSENLLVGALAEFDDFSDRGELEAGEAEGNGFLIGPYVMARLAPELFAEVRAAWGSSDNVVNPLGTYADAFETNRALYSGSLVGQFDIGKATQIRPEFTLRYLDETQAQYTDSLGVIIPEQSVGQGDISFRPRFQQIIALDSGWTLRPFIETEGIYTFGTNANSILENGLRARIEGGVDFMSGNGFRASVGAFHDGIGADNFESSGVHVSVSFGF